MWRSLPGAQRTDGQIVGITAVGCGATHSIKNQRWSKRADSRSLRDLYGTSEPAVCRDLRRFIGGLF
ncbi:MAG: hypothetical protein VYD18_15545 [Candidatus Latescibacterota bacterium]|nr:hypothetical protein [Candidatus Latescibacterota bacterium]